MENLGQLQLVITGLYACVGVFNAVLYTPQIWRSWSSASYALGQSVVSWGGWTITSVIAVLFGLFVVQNWFMVTVATVDVIGHILVVIPALKARVR